MHTDLSSVPPEKSQLFLDHLRAELPYSANLTIANDETNDRFEEDFYTELERPEGSSYGVQVSVRWDRSGRLLEVFAQSDSDSDWRDHFASCVQSALVNALAEQTESFFRNEVFAFIGSPLVGEYRFGGFRLAQVTPVDPAVRIPVEHAVVLSSSVQAPDRIRADLLSHARAEDFMAVLGALLGVGFYRFRHERFWGIASDGQALRARHAFEPTSLPEAMPQRSGADERGVFEGRTEARYEAPGHLFGTARLTVWSDTRTLLRSFEALPLEDRERFLGAARLFQLALTAGRHLTTVRIAYQIAALDSLRPPGLSSRDALVVLVKNLVPGADLDEVREAYDKVRSAHFHAGRLVAVDRESTRVHIAPFVGGHHGESWRRLERILWLALVAWLRGPAPGVPSHGATP